MKDERFAGHEHHRRGATPAVAASRQSAEQLFREHASFVAAFLARLGVDSADIDDGVQDVFMTAHKRGGFVAGTAKPRSWLASIAVRIALNRRRSRARRREDSDEAALGAARTPSADPAEAAEMECAQRRVTRALEGMDLDHRVVFVLYEIEGESCQDIANSLNIPIGTVYSRLHIARQRFAAAYAMLAEPSGALALKRAMESP